MTQSTRAAVSTLIRVSRSSASRSELQRWSKVRSAIPLPSSRAAPMWIRWQSQGSSTGEGGSKAYAFEDMKDLISKPSKERLLIDTREPSELQETGRIPTALNIPIKSNPDSFFISEEEFEDRFGFERPPKDKEIVFYCRSGVRSRAAAELARQGGWEKTGEYAGSWIDWVGKGGVVER